jgi:hypothetical protein
MPHSDKPLLTSVLPALLVALGLFFGASVVSKAVRKSPPRVSVKGLSEREANADLALWTLTVNVTNKDIAAAEANMAANQEIVKAFLNENGFSNSEITSQSYAINKTRPKSLSDSNENNYTYEVDAVYNIRTNDVNKIKKAAEKIGELYRKGILINSTPSYLFTKLKDIKSEMLSEAVKNARQAGEQFAKDSDVQLGRIVEANQGSFVITGTDRSADNDAYDYKESRSIMKKVRVVSTITFEMK